MAKVKSSKASRSGNSAGSASGVGATINAKRGDFTRTFRSSTWDMLPPDKEGWVEVTEKPAAVKTKAPEPDAPKEPAMKVVVPDPAKDEVKKPTLADLEKVDTSKLSSVEKRKHTLALKAAKAEGEANASKVVVPDPAEGMVNLTVDQEYLDTHPEEAAKGTAVNQVIQVPKED